MYYVYILKSLKDGKYYIGSTSNKKNVYYFIPVDSVLQNPESLFCLFIQKNGLIEVRLRKEKCQNRYTKQRRKTKTGYPKQYFKDVEKSVSDSGAFIRYHKSYIANLQ